MTFAGYALKDGSATGLLVSLWVYIIYRIALYLEEPFTAGIYAERDRQRKGKKKAAATPSKSPTRGRRRSPRRK